MTLTHFTEAVSDAVDARSRALGLDDDDSRRARAAALEAMRGGSTAAAVARGWITARELANKPMRTV